MYNEKESKEVDVTENDIKFYVPKSTLTTVYQSEADCKMQKLCHQVQLEGCFKDVAYV